MGGLVVRYALAYMEENGLNHDAKLFISYDSPQNGAHVPVGIQALATTFNSQFYKDLIPELEEAIYQFISPAAQQMLKYRIYNPTVISGEITPYYKFVAFQDEINSLNNCNGYPTQCRNVAISLGSWNGIGQRSNIDIDNNSELDLQHSAFPLLFINIPHGADSYNPQPIWTLNTCQTFALTFQIFLSSTFSDQYPYYSDRYNYAGLQNWAYVTYLYSNAEVVSPGLFPAGAWSRAWYYQNYEPTDFAPGSYIPAYADVNSALSMFSDCSFSYADNSTFIPTISALAFNTYDLFYNIADDPNRLDKTPFDNIIGIYGDNTSHRSNQTNSLPIQDFIIDEITNDYGFSCAYYTTILTDNISTGDVVLEKGSQNLIADGYYISNGATVIFTASNEITLKPGFVADYNSEFHAYISDCGPKPCDWLPANIVNGRSSIMSVNYIESDFGALNSGNVTKMENSLFQIFPNPNNGYFIINCSQNAEIEFINSFGITIKRSTVFTGENKFDLSFFSKGLYIVSFKLSNDTVVIKKMIIN